MRIILAFLFLASTAYALDPASQEAKDKTSELLRDPKQREQAVKENGKTKAADAQMKHVMGNEQNTQKAYEISADIMDKMVEQTGGDSSKMQEILEQAQKDPEGFYNKLTPEQKKQIEELAGKVSVPPTATSTSPRR
jgi:hypothetical protein